MLSVFGKAWINGFPRYSSKHPNSRTLCMLASEELENSICLYYIGSFLIVCVLRAPVCKNKIK